MEEFIKEHIVESALVVIPALWVIGKCLKKSHVAGWLIPWVLLILGITGTVSLIGATAEAVIQGVLVTGAAVFGHQLLKQTYERR